MPKGLTAIERGFRCYNAGQRIVETLNYSLPDGHDIHCVASWRLEAPEKEFFYVPQFLEIEGARIHVTFLETLLRSDRWGGKGVVLLDPMWDPPEDEAEAERISTANDDKGAIAKAGRHWKIWCKTVAEAWIEEQAKIRAANGVPRRAQGATKNALEVSGLTDPADLLIPLARAAELAPDGELTELRQMVKLLAAQVEKLMGQTGGKPGDTSATV